MDHAGNLAYVHSGRYPVRAEGHDSRLPAVGTGQWDWQGLRPYSDNPTVRNPEQGYIANWNNRPAAGWISSDLWSYTWSRADRVRLIFDALERAGQTEDSRHTVATVRDINRDISFADVNAPFLLPFLFSAWEDQPQTPQISTALGALQAWDQQWPVDGNSQYGPLPTLMEAWLRGLLADVFKDDIGDDYFHLYAATNYPNNPLGASMGTPPGVRAMVRNLDLLSSERWSDSDYDFFNDEDPAAVLRLSFTSALASVATQQGANLPDWRLTAAPMQWQPYNFRGVPQASKTTVYTLPSYMNRGSENNLFIANGKSIAAWDVIPPGQSGFHHSSEEPEPHLASQLQLYADFGYKPVPFEVEDVRAAAQSTLTLTLKDSRPLNDRSKYE